MNLQHDQVTNVRGFVQSRPSNISQISCFWCLNRLLLWKGLSLFINWKFFLVRRWFHEAVEWLIAIRGDNSEWTTGFFPAAGDDVSIRTGPFRQHDKQGEWGDESDEGRDCSKYQAVWWMEFDSVHVKLVVTLDNHFSLNKECGKLSNNHCEQDAWNNETSRCVNKQNLIIF